MSKRPMGVWLVAVAALGSGLVNLYSVIGPALPERRALLREFFPLEFLHLSRTLTLLIGFALVIFSINIYKRKRRAFQLVLLLSCLSILFHLTKGLDYEEAIASLVLLIVLLSARKHFTVKSSIPDWRWAMIRFGIAAFLAFSYGVVGFWLLDKREFGIDFTFSDAMRRTLSFLSLVGDSQIVPHTRYAHWFLSSLYLMTVTSIGYAGFALFRPVIYKFRTLPHERARAVEIVNQHGRSSMDYFKLWPDKSYFFSPSRNCFLAYRVAGNLAMVLADPVGPEDEIEQIVRHFTQWCEDNDWSIAFYQTLPDFLDIYQRLGFKKLKIGDGAIVDLTHFTLDGKAMKKFRHTVNQLDKSGVHIRLFEPPIEDEMLREVKAVSDEWLRIPGRRERRFTLGMYDPHYVRSTTVFAAVDREGTLLAFANLVPSYRKGEATIDLMRYRTNAPNGIMDYLFVKLFLHCREKGFLRFNLGMAPMAGFEEKEQATPAEKAVHYFFQQLGFLFSYTGLRQFKAKFASFWEPLYVIYRSPFELPMLAMALRKITEFKD